jgi:hypothetical protein
MKSFLLLILTLCWTGALLGAILACFVLFLTMTSSKYAPQEASGTAFAIACAVIPYCFARAVTELFGDFAKSDSNYQG